jgi:hypothetical protein
MTTSLIRDTADPPQRSRITDELDGIVATVCAKFPGRSRGEIEHVVATAYAHLRAGATVQAHLIPLTLNRSLRELRRAEPNGM